MTQKLIANMLGVRRVDMTNATGKLQRNGLVSYGSGRVTVMNRPKLEDLACEC